MSLEAALSARPTRPAFAAAIVVVILLATTADAGATTHLPAFFLRGLAIVACLWLWPRAPVRLRRRDLVPPLVAAVTILAALPTAAHFGPAIQAVASAAAIIGLYLVLVSTAEDYTADTLLLCVAVGLAHAVWALVEWTLLDAPRGRGGFFNPNDLAACLAPLTVLTLARALVAPPQPSPWPKRVQLLTAVVLGLGLIATGSRAGILAFGLGALLLLATPAWRLVLPIVLALVLTVVLVPGLRARWAGAGDAFAWSRTDIWRASVEVALDNPLGVGLGGFTAALRQHGVPLDGPVRFTKTATDAHSEPLTVWVELGTVGVVAALLPAAALLGGILRRWRRRSRTGPATAAPPVAVATLVTFVVPACLSASLHVPPVALLAALWAAHITRHDDASGPTWPVATNCTHRFIGGTVLVLAFAATLPGLASAWALDHATRARDAGDLDTASRAAVLAHRAAPWMLGPGMLLESLRLANGTPALDVANTLVDLADRFPSEPEPVERAAWVLESLPAVRGPAAENRSRLVIALTAEATRRDPKNALGFVRLGRLRARAGDAAGARDAYASGLAIEPSCGACLAALATYARQDGQLDQARALAARALRAHEEAGRFSGRAHEILAVSADSLAALQELEYRSP